MRWHQVGTVNNNHASVNGMIFFILHLLGYHISTVILTEPMNFKTIYYTSNTTPAKGNSIPAVHNTNALIYSKPSILAVHKLCESEPDIIIIGILYFRDFSLAVYYSEIIVNSHVIHFAVLFTWRKSGKKAHANVNGFYSTL